MSIRIKQLGAGSISAGGTADPLFTAVGSNKAQIIKNIRFVNTSTSASTTLSLYLNKGGSSYRISPVSLTITPGGMYVDNEEITLEATQSLKAVVGSGAGVEWVASGVERDET